MGCLVVLMVEDGISRLVGVRVMELEEENKKERGGWKLGRYSVWV